MADKPKRDSAEDCVLSLDVPEEDVDKDLGRTRSKSAKASKPEGSKSSKNSDINQFKVMIAELQKMNSGITAGFSGLQNAFKNVENKLDDLYMGDSPSQQGDFLDDDTQDIDIPMSGVAVTANPPETACPDAPAASCSTSSTQAKDPFESYCARSEGGSEIPTDTDVGDDEYGKLREELGLNDDNGQPLDPRLAKIVADLFSLKGRQEKCYLHYEPMNGITKTKGDNPGTAVAPAALGRRTSPADPGPSLGSFSSIRRRWTSEGISADVANVLWASWKPSTLKQYKLYWDRWFQFCQQGQINPFDAPVGHVLDFLMALYQQGLSYSSLNTARSALSVLITNDNTAIGSHPLIIRFLKGVFLSNPVVQKCPEIWDVRIVLNFLRTLSPVRNLSLKKLSVKLVLLLSLVTAQRGQTIWFYDIENMDISDSCSRVNFILCDHIKTSRPGCTLPSVEVRAYPPDRRICVITVLNEYIARTASLRGKETKLFVTYVKPHRRVSRDTLSRWIRLGLSWAGIDVKKYSAHSTRSAAVSAAHRANVPVFYILEKAGWASERTFAKFYKKNMERNNFSNSVLSQ